VIQTVKRHQYPKLHYFKGSNNNHKLTHCNEFDGYDPFLASMGDINGDGLADLVWMSKQDPFQECSILFSNSRLLPSLIKTGYFATKFRKLF
jgi:hypothetical protein